MQVKPQIVIPLKCFFVSFFYFLLVNVPYDVENTKVTLIDANHCPGAVIFIFEVFKLEDPVEDNLNDVSPVSNIDFSSIVAAYSSDSEVNIHSLYNNNKLLIHPLPNPYPLPSRAYFFNSQITPFSFSSSQMIKSPPDISSSLLGDEMFNNNNITQSHKISPSSISRIVIHTGDFRFSPTVFEDLCGVIGDRQIDGICE